ncbi:endolytic transglycosylase MltG [Sphingosinicella humi]|uniref:Endolytic murein transglycosylase n=1 Tax=Allosphingosinicella humi TaxID=2068657 RepID=A0A2U2J5M8_9SPHN|nr:endolytic transglycosylase MltG [Sphingosinicella humi]PWG03653.1 endolytic transglycosylase MltG [Sphingosinicella humi]
MKKWLLILIALAALAAAGGYVALWTSAGPKEGPYTIVVEQGATLSDVAAKLEAAGAIPGNATTFRGMARLFGSDDPVQAGEFLIPKGANAAEILDLLQHGQPIQRLVTIPEGMPSILVHERLMGIPYLTGQIPVPEEGSVLPDSYGYHRGETRAAVLERMQQAMTRELDALWAKRQPHSAVDTKQEAIILASIVEKETAKPTERRMVAGVYSNRLKVGMPLQADPTVIYPVTKGKPLGRRIRRSELDAANGYNTYAMAGLPAGPIANPGRLSIAAVLNPAKTEALYFVADGTGGHIFANTLAEHNANVAKWYAIRRARGEM